MSEKHKTIAKTPGIKSTNVVSRKPETASPQSSNSPIERIFSLQRSIGNQAAQRLLKSGVLQAKLKIGQPNDIYEQEADRVAAQVVSIPEPHVQRQLGEEEEGKELQTRPVAKKITPLVQHQPIEEEEEKIQTKPLVERKTPLGQKQVGEESEVLQAKEVCGQTPGVNPNLESRIDALRGGSGQPLPETARTFFESRLGYDFSHVRVHTGSDAMQLNSKLNAQAFTVGKDIYFASGRYCPHTSLGKRLLAHELTHVVQQGNDEALSRIMAQGRRPRAKPAAPTVSLEISATNNPVVVFSRPVSAEAAWAILFDIDWKKADLKREKELALIFNKCHHSTKDRTRFFCSDRAVFQLAYDRMRPEIRKQLGSMEERIEEVRPNLGEVAARCLELLSSERRRELGVELSDTRVRHLQCLCDTVGQAGVDDRFISQEAYFAARLVSERDGERFLRERTTNIIRDNLTTSSFSSARSDREILQSLRSLDEIVVRGINVVFLARRMGRFSPGTRRVQDWIAAQQENESSIYHCYKDIEYILPD